YAARKLLADVGDSILYRSPSRFWEKIVRDAAGYTRSYESGRSDRFDSDGRLVASENSDAGTFRIDRTKPESIVITEKAGRAILLERNAKGQVIRITSSGRPLAAYEYDAKGLLIQSTDMDNDTCRYQYDGDGNLSSIAKNGKVTAALSY